MTPFKLSGVGNAGTPWSADGCLYFGATDTDFPSSMLYRRPIWHLSSTVPVFANPGHLELNLSYAAVLMFLLVANLAARGWTLSRSLMYSIVALTTLILGVLAWCRPGVWWAFSFILKFLLLNPNILLSPFMIQSIQPTALKILHNIPRVII